MYKTLFKPKRIIYSIRGYSCKSVDLAMNKAGIRDTARALYQY